eukprot:COSAG05_NODE_21765_length_269_cov_0.911765_1_plen_63_part_10
MRVCVRVAGSLARLQRSGLNLLLVPYRCLATGEEEGLLEVVSPALTLLEIMRRGSGTNKSGFL